MITPIHICVIAKNEGLYVREWIEFHRLVGVSRFTIYDNDSTDDTAAILKEYDFVEVVPWPHAKPCQLAAYQDYIDRHRGESAWCAFIDLDEFLFPVQCDTILEALNMIVTAHPQVNAVGVNWSCFGANGRQSYSSEPVIERFTQRLSLINPVNTHIKSIIRMDQEVKTGGDPHFFYVETGIHNENGLPIYGPHHPHSSAILCVNHYHTKSYDEWKRRKALGTPDRVEVVIDLADFDGYQAADAKDYGIQRFLPELKRRLAL